MENITTKEVLLSTRDKLAELKTELNKLATLTNFDYDKNIDDVRYVLHPPIHREKPELSCVVEYNKKRLKGIWKELKKHLNLYIWGTDSHIVLWDNSGKCHLNIGRYCLGVDEMNQKEFRAIAEGIFNDEFVLNFLKNTYFYPNETGVLGHIDIAPDLISMTGTIKDSFHNVFFTYRPLSNTAQAICHEPHFQITGDMIKRMLEVELNNECFDDYQRNYIESSPVKDKEILVPRFTTDEHKVDFRVVEDEKCLRLVRK
jgi:hypothetical protein